MDKQYLAKKMEKKLSDKPKVGFIGVAQFQDTAHGKPIAWVLGVDHPHLGAGYIRTSLILNIFDDGSFETLNTLYVPVKEGDDGEDRSL